MALVFMVGSVLAHDMWLEPEHFVLAEGDSLIVRMLIGHDLEPMEESQLLRTMTPVFDLVTDDSTFDLLDGLPDMREQPMILPVLQRRLDFEGLALIRMDHEFIYTQFENARFAAYLEEEGLEEHIRIDTRDDSVQTERYNRSFKSLIKVGSTAAGDIHKEVVGQTTEILLLQNPYLLQPGDSLDVQVLFEGAPLVNRFVTALHRGHTAAEVSTQRVLSDSSGVARFFLDASGLWLIQAIQMRASPDPYTDWESFWSTYSFLIE